jgi:hypothetical protein
MKRLIVIFFAVGALWGQGSIVPLLNCVTYNPAASSVTATFGYVDTNTVSSSLPIGIFNFFDPPPSERNQLTNFQPGTANNQFQATWQLGDTSFITWNLDGFSVTATNNPANYCALGYSACWDTNGNGVCDPSEDINGDGVCNALDCQGRVGVTGPTGPAGAQGPAGSQGPAGLPGISPAIVSVTVPSGAATATASCTTPQVLLNGGGMCAVPNTNTISGRLASSAPSGSNGWTVTCSTGNATAVALCALPGGSQ